MTKFYLPATGPEPSEMFLDALTGIGSTELECRCGRVHLCPDSTSIDASEQDSWTAYCETQYQKHPDTTVLHYDADAVVGKELDGSVFVECCECNGLRKYEDFIWRHRKEIRRYLKTRVDQEKQWADEEHLCNVLAGIV